MGQIFSWFRGPRDTPALQDVAVEEQSQAKQPTPTPAAPAPTVKPAEYEVQVEVPSSAGKVSTSASAADPFDALADSLPSSKPLAPKAPQFTGPEVKESGLTKKEAELCGVRDSALPPGYRWEDMEKKAPAGKPEKPKEVSKPISEDDALESLSAGFVSSAPKTQVETSSAAKTSAPEKKTPAGVPDKPKDTSKPLSVDDAVESLSAGFASSSAPSAPKAEAKVESAAAKSSHAPPPPSQKRQEVPAPKNVSPAPPADKKAKVEKVDSMSLDALSALEDTLPQAKPVPKSPKLRPEDIIDEKKAKAEKGVRVGEREDTIPPEYRFSADKHKDRPAPPKEPSMDPAEALDILSGDFTSPSAAPVVKAPVPPSAKQQSKVEDLSALDALSADFVAPAQSKKVASGAPPAPPQATKSNQKSTSVEGDPLSLDALSALEDMLPAAKPVPESPKLRPEDIVKEKELTSEKGVRVGERDDTLPPEYRFSKEEELKKHPHPPKKEPSMDPAEALDLLAGDFTSSSNAPAVHAPVPPSAPPADISADFDLDFGDAVTPTASSKVSSAVTGPPKADRQLSEGTASAMDALSDTLMDMTPAPEPKPVAPKDVVKEKTVVEEKVTKPGERDDSLPPEYRPTEADKKAAAEAKAKAKADVTPKQKSMDETAALDALSSDFTTSPVAPPAAPVVPAPSKAQSTSTKSQDTHTAPKASGPVLDKLATTLLPDLSDTKPKDSKPKGKGTKSKSKAKKPAVEDVQATGNLPGKPSTDVVSTKKGGKS